VNSNWILFSENYFNKAYRGVPARIFNELKRWYYSILSFVIRNFNLNLERGYALDVGAGYGYVTTLLDSLGYTSIGCDISFYAMSVAKKLVPKTEFVVCDACHLPFRDEAFAICTQFEILEHLKKPSLALKEGYRILKENGYLIATSPNPNDVLHKVPLYSKLVWASPHKDKTHINVHSPNDWRRLLKTFSFSAFKVGAISYLPFLHRFFNKLMIISTPDNLGHTILIVAYR
jgi:ubiquinone/menaquinone biosynthesis C-methylase UbiE